MADKKTGLAIVVSTVDKATAGINSIDKRVKALTDKVSGPFDAIQEKLSSIGKATGITAILGAASAIGSAIKGVFSAVSETLQTAVSGVLSLVSHFDDLGDKAEKLDVTVDFLASMRYAAERSGSSIEALDQGLTAFGENMGQLRGGTGRMLKSLQQWAPALVPMLKATHGNRAALLLLGDAMSKITDPQKRLAFALKTVGNSDLVPMLAKGSAGMLEFEGEFAGLAGSLEEAAAAAGQADDDLKKLKASSEGLKAGLMRGLAPALNKIIPMMTQWLSGHREQITQWLIDFGEKLPGAVDSVVNAIKGAVDWVDEVAQSMGGWDSVGRAVKDLLKGGLLAAMLVVKQVATELAVAVKAMMIAWDVSPIKAVIEWFGRLGEFLDSIGVKLEHVMDLLLRIMGMPGVDQLVGNQKLDAIDRVSTAAAPAAQPLMPGREFRGPYPLEARPIPQSVIDAATRSRVGGPAQQQTPAKVIVDFRNAPTGMRATADPRNTTDVDLSVGHQLMGGGM